MSQPLTPRLHVLRAGDGPKLLLLHGIGGSATAWNAQMARLGRHFSCIAPDLPGYGESADPTAEGLDALLQAVVELLAGEAAHVLGVSFGGLLALALARRHPALVRSLVLADATLGRADLAAEARQRWLQGRQALALQLQSKSRERAAEIAAQGAREAVLDEIALHMRRARPQGYMTVARIIADTDARPWLPAIAAPALVLCGSEDKVTGPAMSRTLIESLPSARLQTLAGAGHAPHIEQPEAFAQAVRKFLLRD